MMIDIVHFSDEIRAKYFIPTLNRISYHIIANEREIKSIMRLNRNLWEITFVFGSVALSPSAKKRNERALFR